MKTLQEDKNQSLIPMFVDDGEVTVCDSISGGANEVGGMPRELSLLRTKPNGTEVRQQYIQHNTLDVLEGVEILYGFVAWLTTKHTPVTFSDKHNAGEAVDLIARFCEANNLRNSCRENYADYLTHPESKEQK